MSKHLCANIERIALRAKLQNCWGKELGYLLELHAIANFFKTGVNHPKVAWEEFYPHVSVDELLEHLMKIVAEEITEVYHLGRV